MRPQDRRRFDRLLEEVLAELPNHLRELLEEVPLIVEDFPDADLMEAMEAEAPEDLCGTYTGIPLTERSVEHSGVLPEQILIFREGILASAGDADDAESDGRAADADLKREIRVTVLHEMGHHFGLEEEDLRKYGYE